MLPYAMVIPTGLHLSDNTRYIRLGSTWNDHWPPHKTFAAQKSKTQGLFGPRRDANLVKEHYLGIGHLFSQVVDNVGIVRATAAHIDLVNTFLRTPSLIRLCEGLCRDTGYGRYAIFWTGTV